MLNDDVIKDILVRKALKSLILGNGVNIRVNPNINKPVGVTANEVDGTLEYVTRKRCYNIISKTAEYVGVEVIIDDIHTVTTAMSVTIHDADIESLHTPLNVFVLCTLLDQLGVRYFVMDGSKRLTSDIVNIDGKLMIRVPSGKEIIINCNSVKPTLESLTKYIIQELERLATTLYYRTVSNSLEIHYTIAEALTTTYSELVHHLPVVNITSDDKKRLFLETLIGVLNIVTEGCVDVSTFLKGIKKVEPETMQISCSELTHTISKTGLTDGISDMVKILSDYKFIGGNDKAVLFNNFPLQIVFPTVPNCVFSAIASIVMREDIGVTSSYETLLCIWLKDRFEDSYFTKVRVNVGYRTHNYVMYRGDSYKVYVGHTVITIPITVHTVTVIHNELKIFRESLNAWSNWSSYIPLMQYFKERLRYGSK